MNLAHKRVLITRPSAQAEEFANILIAEGALPVFFPVIEISPLLDFSLLDAALLRLDRYDGLVLTSIHGVNVFLDRLEILGIQHIPKNIRVAAVGSKTALGLNKHGLTVDFIPNEYIAEAVPSGLGEVSEKHVLLLQSNLAGDVLATQIRSAGGIVDEIVAYHTRTTKPAPAGIDVLNPGVDVITFASPSSVRGFMDILARHTFDAHDLPGNPRFACIGPVTAVAAREAWLPVHVVAKKHTMAGLVMALKEIQESG